MNNVRYDEGGNAVFLGKEIGWWGQAWIARVATKLSISPVEAENLLDRGGVNGTPMAKDEVYKILN
jgi:hypothetical protein